MGCWLFLALTLVKLMFSLVIHLTYLTQIVGLSILLKSLQCHFNMSRGKGTAL